MNDDQPTIVVIDDSPASISLCELSVRQLAVRLAMFESPADSLAFLRNHEAELVFLDILMRHKDGLSVLRELRTGQQHRDTPVVIVTSKDNFQDRAQARQLGAVDYLVKPLRSQEIREVIHKYTRVRAAPGNGSTG